MVTKNCSLMQIGLNDISSKWKWTRKPAVLPAFIPIFRFDCIPFQKPFFKSVFQPETSLEHLTYPISLSIYSICRKASLPLIAKYDTKKNKRKEREQENRCQPRPSCHTSWNIVHLSARKISYQHGVKDFSKDHAYVWLNFMKAHLSPSHIHSRKCLHFFLGIANWSCSPKSSFLFPISPSHGSSPYGSVGLACAYMNFHIWCHGIVDLKHTSLSAYLPLCHFVYIKQLQWGSSRRKWEPSTLLNPLELCSLAQVDAQKPHTQHTHPIFC